MILIKCRPLCFHSLTLKPRVISHPSVVQGQRTDTLVTSAASPLPILCFSLLPATGLFSSLVFKRKTDLGIVRQGAPLTLEHSAVYLGHENDKGSDNAGGAQIASAIDPRVLLSKNLI